MTLIGCDGAPGPSSVGMGDLSEEEEVLELRLPRLARDRERQGLGVSCVRQMKSYVSRR